MMDYSAGQGRPTGNTISNEQGKAFSSNSNWVRPQNAGGVSMHVSSGAPHVLLFERDQQFATLLNSQLQLAGYECHMARTAVEVFDAIARYPVRLVLVNLAQAAAARREFWVALDTQRRGRGVQVMTFYCSNLAGYGPVSDDPDDRSHTMLADIEVDGMLGIMNMVNAIRSRIAIANTGTGAMSRPGSGSNSGIESYTQGQSSATGNDAGRLPQTTLPLPTTPVGNSVHAARRPTPIPASAPPQSSNIAQLSQPSQPSPSQSANGGDITRTATANSAHPTNPANPGDKIRAVMYPNQRSWSAPRDTENTVNPAAYVSSSSPAHSLNIGNGGNGISMANAPAPTDIVTERQTRNEAAARQQAAEPKESGLAQLSRLVQEHRAPLADATRAEGSMQDSANLSETTLPQPRVLPADISSISSQPLRASPIEDLPIERTTTVRNAGSEMNSAHRYDSASGFHPASSYAPTSTLASIATSTPVSATPPTSTVAEPATEESFPSHISHEPQPERVENTADAPHAMEYASEIPLPATVATPPAQQRTGAEQRQEQQGQQGQHLTEQLQSMLEEHAQQRPTETPVQESARTSVNAALLDLVQAQVQQQQRAEAVAVSTVQPVNPINPISDNGLLLDVVQSLPPMSSPPPQPQILNGRATRSLGSVLLEGHLVPRDRLEVALGIQRMLRGVDMSYQLGEILLMFKLLTPDQLLAASLVSYGLITTTQISALGRIRQELHSIGLEYDLENLLILFRMLTSEQLREVRVAWAS